MSIRAQSPWMLALIALNPIEVEANTTDSSLVRAMRGTYLPLVKMGGSPKSLLSLAIVERKIMSIASLAKGATKIRIQIQADFFKIK